MLLGKHGRELENLLVENCKVVEPRKTRNALSQTNG